MKNLKIFKDWSALGYTVKRGSHAHWVDGVPMFDETQVKKYERREYGSKRKYSSGTEYYGCTPKGGFDHWGHEATFEEFY